MKRAILFAAACFAAGFTWADPGVALRADTLRAEAFTDARSVGILAKGEKVNIEKKKGGWVYVKAAVGSGWVRILSVRGGVASGSNAGAEVGGLLALGSGRAGSGNVVSTAGIRGLDEEDLKGAKFNEAEIKRAESFAASADDARKFAVAGGLKAQGFDFLPDPEKEKRQQESPWGNESP